MNKVLYLGVVCFLLLTGCASVEMAPKEESDLAKQFNPPSDGKAGVYVYRSDSHFGGALKKDVWINKKCIGETAKGVFFYHEVDGDKEHTISTESEFSPNDLLVKMKKGALYFFHQYIKFGLFVGGAGIEQKSETDGKKAVSTLSMAKKGKCDADTVVAETEK